MDRPDAPADQRDHLPWETAMAADLAGLDNVDVQAPKRRAAAVGPRHADAKPELKRDWMWVYTTLYPVREPE